MKLKDITNSSGLYCLIWQPQLKMGETEFFTSIKIGRTGNSFKKRFRGYTGRNRIDDNTTIHFQKLRVPENKKKNYGFTEEEAFLKKKVKEWYVMRKKFFKEKPEQEEFYQIKTQHSHKFIKVILDAFEKIKEKNKAPPPPPPPPPPQPPLLQSLWKFAWPGRNN